jgi:heme exporter protein CcmD
MSLTHLLDPTGHGPFILASYGISLVVLVWNVAAPLVRDRNLRREIRNEIRARKNAA